MQTCLDIVLDYSNSMGNLNINGKNFLLPDGTTRFSLAKNIFLEVVIPNLDYADIIRVWSFYGKDNSLIPTEVYLGKIDKEDLRRKINDLGDPKNTGSTPISLALNYSIDFIKAEIASDKKIILITDGEEDSGTNFFDVIQKALSDGINFSLFIVGIGQNKEVGKLCSNATEATGGVYVNLESAVYDKAKLTNDLRPIFVAAINSSISSSQNKVEEKINNLNTQAPITSVVHLQQVKKEFAAISEQQNRSIQLIQKQIANLEAVFNERFKSQSECINDFDKKFGVIDYKVDVVTFEQKLNMVSKKIELMNEHLKHIQTEMTTSINTFKSYGEEKSRGFRNQLIIMWFFIGVAISISLYAVFAK